MTIIDGPYSFLHSQLFSVKNYRRRYIIKIKGYRTLFCEWAGIFYKINFQVFSGYVYTLKLYGDKYYDYECGKTLEVIDSLACYEDIYVFDKDCRRTYIRTHERRNIFRRTEW